MSSKPVQNLLIAKIAELEHAYIVAVRLGDHSLAAFWNRELIFYLLRLHDSIRDTESPS
jgi:hypothetical protein